jgi:hypothetical protein
MKKEKNRMTIKSNKRQIEVEQQRNKSNNNIKMIHDVTGTRGTMHNINKSLVSLLKQVEM